MKAKNRFLILTVIVLIFSSIQTLNAQNIRWLRIGQLQSPINETGAEYEGEFNLPNSSGNFLSWPVQYNIDQTVARYKGIMIGCKNFYDPVEGKLKSVKVVTTGFKAAADPNQIFIQELKLIGKSYHPKVYVDDQGATVLDNYDVLDEVDPSLPCDRMVLVKYNTSMGISVTKKVMAFSSSKHSNYFIYDYVFKNTGIVDAAGTVQQPRQTLDSVWVYFMNRYAFAGVSSQGFGSTWGAFASQWGQSTLNHAFGENPAAPAFNDPTSPLYQLRGYYSYYGPWNGSPRSSVYEEDWGCPKLSDPESGTLGSAKYAGCVTLYADKSTQNHIDDLEQPKTTWFFSPDFASLANTAPSQYDETDMLIRYGIMTEGHPPVQHDDLLGNTYPDNYRDPRRNLGGGVAMGQGFGVYNGLAPGDSIHIVFAEGVDGLSWEKGREVGANWLQWHNGTGTPQLVLPDGSTTVDANLYKRKWCETGKDNILQTYRNAKQNYDAGFNVPQPPPPPSTFTVTSGGDKIMLDWANNAENAPHFGGYVIYRSESRVLQYNTIYKKIFECNQSNAVNHYNDVEAKRGFDYYYYIQSKDDGTQVPNETLYSGLFWTVTNRQANLQRPAEPVTPFPPDALTSFWKIVASYKGPWASRSNYSSATHDVVSYQRSFYICSQSTADTINPSLNFNNWKLVSSQADSVAFDKGAWVSGGSYADTTHDIVTFNGSSYVCIDTISHDAISPDLDKQHWQSVAARGNWATGSHYNAHDVVSYSGSSFITMYAIAKGQGLELVRVVPNPYDIRARFYQFGDQSQYDRLAFYGLPPICKLKIYTERGDLIWQKDHIRGTGDELWDSKTSSGQIVASGIYILHVETTDRGSVFRKFVIIR
ncbi:MAG: hypothetical protein EHM64_11670 [Ignavibacteriae bacterium]|nr:MAG: hypothetical protein EHM64_11670 [Ignavibacteriota bacterium]